eukprot:693256-Prorocentrum_minimum.AAC.51
MIRTGDIVLLRAAAAAAADFDFAAHCRRFAEIGPGKKRSVDDSNDETIVTHEVFRLEAKARQEVVNKKVAVAEYAEDSVWVRRSDIVAHFPVRSASDFHEAWKQLGFLVQEVRTDSDAVLEFVFRFEPDTGVLPKLQERDQEAEDQEDNSDSEDLRSIDSYSTISDDDYDSSDSFVVPDSAEILQSFTYSPNSGPQSI